MIAALFRTFRTLCSGYFLKMLALSSAATALGYALFFYGLHWLLTETAFVHFGWLDRLLDWFAGLGVGVLVWFAFPAVLPLIAALFTEQIANRIERREYGQEPIPALPFWGEITHAACFTVFSLFVNLVLLPFYLTGVLFPFLYYPVNAYLLGREFFESCAARHLGRREAGHLRKERRFSVLLAGGLLLVMTNTPVINLFAPFLGVAMMVHLYRQLRKSREFYSPDTCRKVD